MSILHLREEVLFQKVCIVPVYQLCKIRKYINISVRAGMTALTLFSREQVIVIIDSGNLPSVTVFIPYAHYYIESF